jgi:hypothetical protein
MLRQYEGELGIFEYDDAECSVGHSTEGEDRLFWLGTSKSVTVTGILRSTRRMFADATLPEGFKLYLQVRGVRDMTAMFINAQIPDNFIFSYEADRDLELTNMFHLAKLGDNFVMHVNGDVSILADLCFYSATFAGDFKCKLPWEKCTSLHSFFKNVKFSRPVELYLTVPVKANVSEMFAGCAIPDDSYITVQGGVNARACSMFADANVGVNSVINLRDLKAGDYNSAFYNCVLQNAVKLLLDTESTEVCTTMFTKAVFPENFALVLEVPYGASVLGALFDTQVPANSNVQMKLANATCLRPEKAELLQKWIQKLAEAKYDDLTSAIAVYVTEHPEKLEECLHIDFDNVSAEVRIKYVATTARVFEKTEASWRERMDMF